MKNTGMNMTESSVKKKTKSKDKPKIYERNPNTGVIRWRYVGESHDKFGWPNYGRILKDK
jgi:hypothetical protein